MAEPGRSSLIRTKPPRLIVFSDATRGPIDVMLARFVALAREAQPETVLFILRDYTLSLRGRLDLAQGIRLLAEQTEQWFGVADRADVALALGACALHLPEGGLSEVDVRAYLRPAVFISRACHDPARAAQLDADAAVLSPIAAGRKGRSALGLAALELARRARESARAPLLYALGGIVADNAAACISAGADGVAVIGAAFSPEPRPLLRALQISRF
jgi:thiamine-phosphate pyrophosphorylase